MGFRVEGTLSGQRGSSRSTRPTKGPRLFRHRPFRFRTTLHEESPTMATMHRYLKGHVKRTQKLNCSIAMFDATVHFIGGILPKLFHEMLQAVPDKSLTLTRQPFLASTAVLEI